MLKLYTPQHAERRPLGISAIATYRPDFSLPNAWYESLMARKFVKHTGIESRAISVEDEVQLAVRSVERLSCQARCDLSNCAGIIFVAPSMIPQSVASKHMTREAARQEQPTRAAYRFAESLGIQPRKVIGINGFCSGYAKAMKMLLTRVAPAVELSKHEFLLVVTSSQISRITDFACKQSGALFGDFATATMVSRVDSIKYPVRLEILDASYTTQRTSKAFFDFHVKQDVLSPTQDGGRQFVAEKTVFSLDGMGIADTAPRAMANAAAQLAQANHIAPDEINAIVPHQAGEGILRLTGMKLEEAGFTAKPVCGLISEVGNVSSGSVPFALSRMWDQLEGNILCPVAAVGAPGKAEVSQGCILLRSHARCTTQQLRKTG